MARGLDIKGAAWLLLLACCVVVFNLVNLHYRVGHVHHRGRPRADAIVSRRVGPRKPVETASNDDAMSLRGVQPRSRAYYATALVSGSYACPYSGEIIPSDALNDDYCDCLDETDEPGTSACANGKFYCESPRDSPRAISSMFVDDGVCDCCDGSDEAPGSCANVCADKSLQHRADDLYQGGSRDDSRQRSPRRTQKTVAAAGARSDRDGPSGPDRILIGIPTVPRRENYLSQTLGALLAQLPEDPKDPLYEKIRVVVMNNSPGSHDAFYRLKYQWTVSSKHRSGGDESAKAKHYFEFVENPGHCKDPTPDAEDPNDLDNPTSKPSREVRKQSCDVVSLADHALGGSNRFTHFVFMEDDFVACSDALRVLDYLLDKVGRLDRRFLAIHFSFGMNGVLLGRGALADLKTYLKRELARLPPDMLYTEWLEAKKREEKRIQYVYRDNLLDHVGEVSTFGVRPARRKWPGCFEPLASAWSLARIETFDARMCKRSDISPCAGADGERYNGTRANSSV